MALAIARADWRDKSAYTRLLPGDRRCFAWEWLRRSPAYAGAWASGADLAAEFGLLRYEDPARDALKARPLWRRNVDAAVLRADVLSRAPIVRLDFRRLNSLATVVAGDAIDATEHILLSDGLRSIRIDLLGGSLVARPASLRWSIDGVVEAGSQVLALRQFIALARYGRFARSLHRPQRRAVRWTLMLRVHDAIAAGASHREIVAGLFGVDVTAPRWRAAAGPWRLRVQRLAAAARAALASGPPGWLAGDE